MPMYEYQCRKCKQNFDHLAASMAARDDAVACPHCGSKETARQLSTVAVGASTGGGSAPMPAGGCCPCGKNRGACGMN